MAGRDINQKPALWKGFVQGSIAAMTGGAASHPLDVIKVRMQVQGEVGSSLGIAVKKLNPAQMGLNIYRMDGMKGVFSGLTASLMRQCVYSGTRFGMYDVIKGWMGQRPGENVSLIKKIVAAGSAGAIGAYVANPTDVCMVRMQADGRLPLKQRRGYNNGADAILRIAREEGIATLWRGSQATVNRAIVVTLGQLAGYDMVKESLQSATGMKDGIPLHTASSASAAFIASVLSNPLDVAKTRLMNMTPDVEGKNPYTGMSDCLKKTWVSEGPLALYKGFGPTLARQLPFVIVTFITKEQVARALANV